MLFFPTTFVYKIFSSYSSNPHPPFLLFIIYILIAYALHMETVVSTVYNMANEKLFSIPKILLLPGMIGKQPILLLKIFPFVILSDVVKSYIVSTLTNEIETIGKQVKNVCRFLFYEFFFDCKFLALNNNTILVLLISLSFYFYSWNRKERD